MRTNNDNQTAMDQLHAHERQCDECRAQCACNIATNLLRKACDDLRIALTARTVYREEWGK